MNDDRQADYMHLALECAARAEADGEVPVGCVIVQHEVVIAQGWNRLLGESDASAHAEICAIRAAGKVLKNYRLVDCELYVTLEPCIMCVGAMIHARLGHIVFGAADPKTGAAGSVFDLLQSSHHNHRPGVTGGILADECSAQLSDFFRRRRLQKKRVSES
jgi:tRNA(adenine34) deaminase